MATPADILANSEALITEMNTKADLSVQKLEAIASVPEQTWVDFDLKQSPRLVSASTIVSGDDFPSLEKVPFDTSIGEFDPNAYKQNVYESTFYTFLEPYLIQQIEDGGPGISTDVQNALFDDQRENDLQTMADALDSVRSNYGRKGFPLPTMVLRGQENDVIKKYQDVKANRSREITTLLAERTSDFVKTALSQGNSMEEARMRFALGFSGLFNQITDSAISRFKAEQAARVTEFSGQLQLILAKLEISKVNANSDLKFNDQIMSQWEVESNQAITQTNSLIAQAEQTTQVKLEAAKSLASYYAALVASTSSQLTGVASDSTTTTISQG